MRCGRGALELRRQDGMLVTAENEGSLQTRLRRQRESIQGHITIHIAFFRLPEMQSPPVRSHQRAPEQANINSCVLRFATFFVGAKRGGSSLQTWKDGPG
jgi:hypothetical protein